MTATEADLLSWFDALCNWGRWGDDDRLGTLNLITPEVRRRAAAEVQAGEVVSCALPIDPRPAADHISGPPQRYMTGTGEGHALRAPDGPRYGGAAEFLGLSYHGYSVTHLDALSHYFWDGRMYGGRPASLVTSTGGATALDVAGVDGIVTRGLLADVPAHRGVPWLEPGESVGPDELDAMGIRPEPGDAVLLRTGYGRRRRERGPDRTGEVGRAGWHASCLPWLHEHGVALIGADTAQDVHPSGYDAFRSPVHAIGIVAMGLWLIDNCDLEDLAATGRRQFLLSVAPLRWVGATGSPVNPLAVL